MNQEKELKIYFTSDVHGYLYPETYADRNISPLGLLSAAADFEKDGNTLVLDGGDMLQGSAFDLYSEKTLSDNSAQAEVMNAAGYDFVTIGNHDFNYGYDYLTGYLKKLHAKAVCANLRIKKEADRELVKPYHIVKLENGLRVAVIGIVTSHVNIWEKPENLTFFEVGDPFEALSGALSEIGDRADIRVCIYHGGYEADLETGKILSTSGEDIGYRICRELPVDILLTGHQHMPFSGAWVNGTFTAQTPDKAKRFLRLHAVCYGDGLHIDAELRAPSEKSVQSVAAVMHTEAEQEAAAQSADTEQPARTIQEQREVVCRAAQQILPVETAVQSWLDRPLGHMSRPLLPDTKIRMAVNGSPIADFINLIQLSYSGAQLSCCGLANEVGGFRQEVTTRDVIASYPFPNTFVVLEIDGKKLKQALERAAEYFQTGLKEGSDISGEHERNIRVADPFIKPKIEHYNYDYFAGEGFFYEIDARRPCGERIVSMCLHGQPIGDDEKLSLCMNNYRASGAGGYEMYQGLKVLKEINTEMTELMVDYLERHAVIEMPEMKYYRVIY